MQEVLANANVPAGQDVPEKAQDAAPATLCAPPVQFVHDCAPATLNVPAPHAMQEAGADAYVPAGQVVPVKAQAAAPATLNSPAPHAMQEAGADTYAPAGQDAMQEAGASAYVPVGQDVPVKAQEVAPETLKAPAAHAPGDALFNGQKNPAGQASVEIV